MGNNSVNWDPKFKKQRVITMLFNYPDVLTPKDIMEILSISKNTLYTMIQKNDIPAFKLGPRVWRFKKEDVIAYLEDAESFRY